MRIHAWINAHNLTRSLYKIHLSEHHKMNLVVDCDDTFVQRKLDALHHMSRMSSAVLAQAAMSDRDLKET